jgi:hypothetical protein
MSSGLIPLALIAAVGFVSPQPLSEQAPSVQFSCRSPGVLTQGEPVSIELLVHNASDGPAIITLGKNHVGNLQLTLRKPTGEVISVDPRSPRRPDEIYTNVPVTLASGESRAFYILVDEWFGSLDEHGVYLLDINFIGTVRRSSGVHIDVSRAASVSFTVVPFDETVVRRTCERLVDVARSTTDPQEARRAAEQLTYVKHPLAVEYLGRLIERGRAVEVAAVEMYAIWALEERGTPEARDALVLARSRARLFALQMIDEARQRMDLKRKPR